MPRYEYECPKCGPFEVNQKMSDPPLAAHTCGAPAERRISKTAFSLKGGGWYADGYGASSKSSGPAETCGAGACASTGTCAAKSSVN